MRRLHGDLLEQGFDVWFDRVDLPSRQLTLHQEIKDAIRGRDRLLHVAGPSAAASEYVREEWLFAVALDKPVIPILRVGDFDVVPETLRLLPCDDFRNDEVYGEQLARLVANLHRRMPPPGRLFGVPELPRYFVPRPASANAVKDILLADLRKPIIVTGAASRVGIYGMGGIGKSLLAAAVARDGDVRRAYPDGIVWVHVGSSPNLVQLQQQIVRTLGRESRFEHADAGRIAVRDALHDKAVLLVFDDVWQAHDVMQIADSGPRCRMLLTTRDAGVLHALMADIVEAQLLSDDESRDLLAEAVGMDVASLPSEAAVIIRECGRLPLALSLCASMVRGEHGVPWSSVANALRNAEIEEIASDHPLNPHHHSLWQVIAISVDALAAEDCARWTELAVFAQDGRVPEDSVRMFWRETGGLSDIASQRLLKRLEERSLIELDAGPTHDDVTGSTSVSLHDLLYDYATRMTADPPALHRRLAEAAWTAYQERPEEFGGYLRDHLPRHLMAASEPLRLLVVMGDARLDYFHQWAERGMAAEGIACLQFLVNELQQKTGWERLITTLATQLARLHNRLGDDEGAERWVTRALTQSGGATGRTEAVALHELGSLALACGHYSRALRAYRQALRLIRRLSSPVPGEIAANLIGLAAVTEASNRPVARTIRLARLALAWAERANDGPHMAEACRLIAAAHGGQMQYVEAETYLDRGLAIAEREHLSAARLSLLASRAWLMFQRVELGLEGTSVADAAFRELRQRAEAAGEWLSEREAWCGLGSIAALTDQPALLDEAFDRLQSLCSRRTRPHLEARLRLLAAAQLECAAHFIEAARAYAQTADYCRQQDLRSREADALVACARALSRSGQSDEADGYWQQAEIALARCLPIRQAIGRRRINEDRSSGPLST